MCRNVDYRDKPGIFNLGNKDVTELLHFLIENLLEMMINSCRLNGLRAKGKMFLKTWAGIRLTN